MPYTIEQFMEARRRLAELQSSHERVLLALSDDVAGVSGAPPEAASRDGGLRQQLDGERAKIEAEKSAIEQLVGDIACSPEGQEESCDSNTWGLEALLEDDTARAIEYLEVSLALDQAMLRRQGGSGVLLSITAIPLGKIYVREGMPEKARWCFEAVLETLPSSSDGALPPHAIEAAVRLAATESNQGNEVRAVELASFAYAQGRNSQDASTQGFAVWAGSMIAEKLFNGGRRSEARPLLEEVVQLASAAEGVEGLGSAAQSAMKLATLGTSLPPGLARAFAQKAVELARAATGVVLRGDYGEGGRELTLYILCSALVMHADVLVDGSELGPAAESLAEAFERSAGLAQERTIRGWVSSVASRFPPGWFDGEDDPADDNFSEDDGE